jgi:soluble lytic murein transglycosylase-like protein
MFWAQTASSATEKQRASVRKQVHASGESSGFFTTPWIDPPKVVAGPYAASATGDCDPLAEDSLRALVVDASQRENVNPKLVHAVIRRESRGKPCAVSNKGAQGLMQLMPATQIELGVRDPFDAADNISGGVRYLRQMLDRYDGNNALALAAYNAGPQRVAPGGKIPDIPETQSYVMSILASLNEEEAPADETRVK